MPLDLADYMRPGWLTVKIENTRHKLRMAMSVVGPDFSTRLAGLQVSSSRNFLCYTGLSPSWCVFLDFGAAASCLTDRGSVVRVQ
ncbi:unnamed protein product [Macrosiphum euphorbiae]|uniref:Uncharacterized protein n=1 Tax=Macrosiphum euphorbiae TaxID=13131 RepID=A0AAV0XP26_9HEMI|nr:unnamed protein product [Macrosiphum euphorbiae]